MNNKEPNTEEVYLVQLKKLSIDSVEANNSTQHSCFCGETFSAKTRKNIYEAVCNDLPAQYKHEGNFYCVLHYPKKDKSKEFQRTLEDRKSAGKYNFRGVWFPDVIDFSTNDWKTYFENIGLRSANKDNPDLKIDFSECMFSNDVYFENINFDIFVSFEGAKFLCGADFSYSNFRKADFSFVIFNSNVSFDSVIFHEDADFWAARFDDQSHIFFRGTKFKKFADFRYSFFIGSIHFEDIQFSEELSGFDFQYIYHANPERTSFRGVDLRPSWFVDADAHKINFEDVDWIKLSALEELNNFKSCINKDQKRIKGKIQKFEDEINNNENQDEKKTFISEKERYEKKIALLEVRKNEACYQLLAIAYRQIANNAEANGHYQDASSFRKLAFDTEWLEKKRSSQIWRNQLNNIHTIRDFKNHARHYHPHILYRLYRWSSSYGENWAWAFTILIGIILSFAILYSTPICNFKDEQLQKNNKENFIKLSVTSQNLPEGNTEIKIIEMPNVDSDDNFLSFNEAIVYSLKVGTLQNPKPEPKNSTATIFILLETIIVPIQLALLALAIRRKFMR